MVNWICGHTDRFKALISHAGVFDLTSKYGTTEELWFPEWEFGGSPWEKPEHYRERSPSSFAANFKTPTLVIHGALDFRVPDAQGLGMFTSPSAPGRAQPLRLVSRRGPLDRQAGQNRIVWWHEVTSWLRPQVVHRNTHSKRVLTSTKRSIPRDRTGRRDAALRGPARAPRHQPERRARRARRDSRPQRHGQDNLARCHGGRPHAPAGTVTGRRHDPARVGRGGARHPQDVGLPPDQPWLPATRTGRDFLLAVGRLYDVEDERLMEHVDHLLDLFDLSRARPTAPIRNYSAGQKKKIALCSALVTEVPVLLLDEPFSGGLDPAGLLTLKRLLQHHARRKELTIVLDEPRARTGRRDRHADHRASRRRDSRV